MIFCYQNHPELLWEKNVLMRKTFENRGWRPRSCKNRIIHLNIDRSHKFLKQSAFSTCSWRFLRSNSLEQFKFKSKKIIGVQKSTGKVRKKYFWRKSIHKFYVPTFWSIFNYKTFKLQHYRTKWFVKIQFHENKNAPPEKN